MIIRKMQIKDGDIGSVWGGGGRGQKGMSEMLLIRNKKSYNTFRQREWKGGREKGKKGKEEEIIFNKWNP